MKGRHLILLGICVAGCAPKLAPTKPAANPTGAPKIETPPVATDELDPKVIENCKQATVLIGNFENGALYATGSGFVTKDGTTIVTNQHVVTGSDEKADACKIVFYAGTGHEQIVEVKADKISLASSLPKTDPAYRKQDIATIKIPKKIAEPLIEAQSEKLHETENMWALGFPNGIQADLGSKDLPSVSVHSMKVERLDKHGDDLSFIQLSGSPTHGNSGGPVVDRDGHVVGVIESLLDERAPILLAVPISKVSLAGVKVADNRSAKESFLSPLKQAAEESSQAPAATSESSTYTIVGRDLRIPNNWTAKATSDEETNGYVWKSGNAIISMDGFSGVEDIQGLYSQDQNQLITDRDLTVNTVRIRTGKDAIHGGVIWNYELVTATRTFFVTSLYFKAGDAGYRLTFFDSPKKPNAKLFNSIIDQVSDWK